MPVGLLFLCQKIRSEESPARLYLFFDTIYPWFLFRNKFMKNSVPFKLSWVSERKLFWMLGSLTIFFIVLLFIQSFFVPYWQDDYFFLVQSQKARLENISWWAPFFSFEKAQFWRPLGINTYWRFVETILGGNVQLAHLINMLLHIFASISVGWFGFTLLKVMDSEKSQFFAGGLVAFLYAIHAAHLLPVIWVSAANSSITVLFSSLMLTFWLKAYSTKVIMAKTSMLILSLFCFVMALLSKEIAIVLPVLALLVSFYLWTENKPSLLSCLIFAVFVIIAFIWLMIREKIVSLPNPAYELKFGSNIARNAISMSLFFFNVPREALRFLITDPSFAIVIWAGLSFIFQCLSFSLFCYAAWGKLRIKGVLLMVSFFIVGCAPYFFLNWNSYAYYIEIGLLIYAMTIALSVYKIKLALVASLLAVISSLISWSGNYFLEYPAVIGRALWAEQQLTIIENYCKSEPEVCSDTIYLSIENEHKFISFDIYGLIYRAGINGEKIVILDKGNKIVSKGPVLVVPAQGDVYLRN